MHLEPMEDPVRAAGPMAPMAPIGPMGPVLPRPRPPAAPSLSYCEAQNFCEAKRGSLEKICKKNQKERLTQVDTREGKRYVKGLHHLPDFVLICLDHVPIMYHTTDWLGTDEQNILRLMIVREFLESAFVDMN